MAKWRSSCWLVLGVALAFDRVATARQAGSTQQQAGSIRGVVHDKDFDAPLVGAQVRIAGTAETTTTNDQGNFVFGQVAPGTYTLVFSKDGYLRQVRANVVVAPGQLTDVDAELAGEFTEMDEFVVEDLLPLGAGSELSLLKLRFASPAIMDSIGSELMSRAGAGDAASALRLVAGASVADGKTAVIRGLPDRYVSSQMNGVRLPSADEDKRAVELDQFPAAVIESIQVSKTFTPDQQGDASGGAVNVKLKGIPSETVLQLKSQYTYNSQAAGRSDFLTYDGGGVGFWGKEADDRDIQFDHLGGNWDGAAGVSRGDAPIDQKWSIAAGGKRELDDGLKIGGLASVFYERDSLFYDNGTDDSYWVVDAGGPMTPKTNQGTPTDGDFKTALFDITKGKQSVQWGALGTAGIESENHSLSLTYLYTHIAEDTATLAEDTRGKEYFFPGYDPDDPQGPGNNKTDVNAAPYLRTETLEYTERTTGTLQLSGKDKLPIDDFGIDDFVTFHAPELEWVLSRSSAALDQPDKRQFGSLWIPSYYDPGFPPLGIPPSFTAPTYYPYKPGANFNLGNFQRIWKTIDEDSEQYSVNVKLPFEQWSGTEGYVKAGVFRDHVDRKFDQDTFSNFGDSGSSFGGSWDDLWSEEFPNENHPILAALTDVDYDGDQTISAWYGMLDLPLAKSVSVIGGARFESTAIGIVNDAEQDALWYPPNATAPVAIQPGDADVDFAQDDVLPSVGLVYTPVENVTLRGSYSRTVARQTFKELTPIVQQEFLGGPVFIGNPDLGMSDLQNYDLRVDFKPYEGGLISLSWFDKRIEDAIEYVQRPTDQPFTTPVNYPKGELSGYELEMRQDLGHFWEACEGLSVGANGTFIDSEVTLPAGEAAAFASPGLQVPMPTRDMTNAPEHLYNLFATYDVPDWGTQIGLFYTVQGDTLVAGAGEALGNFVPNLYAKEYDTLNLSISQKLGKYFKLQFQAKNLTNPSIDEVYRSEFIGDDVRKTSFTRGIDYSISFSAEFTF